VKPGVKFRIGSIILSSAMVSVQVNTYFIYFLFLKDTLKSRSFDKMLIFHVNYFRENSKTSTMK
jgi:GTP-dependent phosphoenolpyruvate carboxykinase